MGFPNGHALVVGISRYLHTTSLPLTVLTDAIDLAQVLKSTKHCGYSESNIRCMLDTEATAEKFREEIRHLARHASPDSTVVIYFSGHGSRLLNLDKSWSSYLVFHDSDINQRQGLISGDELTALLSQISAERLVVILDSCYAGGTGEIKASAHREIQEGLDANFGELLTGEGRAIFASSCENQVSRIDTDERNSRFTKYLLEGLKGAAAAPASEVIRVTELFNYVQSRMENLEKIQEPFFVTKLKKDFPIALAPAGRGVEPFEKATSLPQETEKGGGIVFKGPNIAGRDVITTETIHGDPKIGG